MRYVRALCDASQTRPHDSLQSPVAASAIQEPRGQATVEAVLANASVALGAVELTAR